MKEYQVTEDGITYTLYVEQDDMPVRGNAMASGNDAEDREYEDEIIARLNDGDVWAWAQVTVKASIEIDGHEFTGEDYLGGCSYDDVTDFMEHGVYWDDMKAAAREELLKKLYSAVKAYETLAAVKA